MPGSLPPLEQPGGKNVLSPALARRQVMVFVLVTMAISWAFVPIADGALLPHGPMLAALLVLAGVSGRRGVHDLWAQMTRWRVGWRWYLIAPGIIVAMHAAALAVSAASGLGMADDGVPLTVGALLAVWIPLVFLGGQWEEPGWCGYLVRHLQQVEVRSPLMVLLVAGSVRVLWHTPLVLLGSIPWFDVVFGILALQVIFLWLYNRTGGSVLVVMICHLFANLTMATILPLVAEPDRGRYWLVVVLLEAAVAVGLLLATRGRLGLPVSDDSIANSRPARGAASTHP
jgi:hypothetical protein